MTAAFNSAVKRVAERLFLAQFLPSSSALRRGQEIRQLALEILDLLHRHVVHEAVLHGPEHRGLHFDRDRVVLRLLENFDDALAALELRLGLGIQIRTELRERRQFAELRQIAT